MLSTDTSGRYIMNRYKFGKMKIIGTTYYIILDNTHCYFEKKTTKLLYIELNCLVELKTS